VTASFGAVLALAAGCGARPVCGLRGCDIRDSDCQQMVSEAAACLGQVAPVAVPMNVISRDQYIQQQSATTLSAADEAAFRAWNAGLALFNLAPADLSSSQAEAAQAGDVAAYYSPKDKTITIVDGGGLDPIVGVAILAHEYTHALQDASFDITRLDQQYATDRDRALAIGAIIEGEATYVGDVAVVSLFGDDPGTVAWDGIYRHWDDQAHTDARKSPLPVTLDYFQFAYPFGTKFQHDALVADGWAGVDQVFATPPSGTREVMAGFGAVEPAGGPWAEDLGTDAVPVLPSIFSFQRANRMGAWLVGVLFDRAGLSFAGTASAALRGDMLSIFRDEVTGTAVAAWRMRFMSADLAATVSTMSASLATSERVVQLDRDVIVIAAGDPTILAAIPTDLSFQAVPASAPTAGAPAAAALDLIRCSTASVAISF
jgi:hypothetical protein